MEENARSNAKQVAHLVAESFRRTVESSRLLLTGMSHAFTPERVRVSGAVRHLDQFRMEEVGVTDLFVADTAGTVLFSVRKTTAPENVREQAFFRRAISSRRFSIGNYTVAEASGRHVIHTAMPHLDDRGEPILVYVASIDFEPFERLLQESLTVPDAALAITDERGTILARTLEPDAFVGRSTGNRPEADYMERVGDGTTEAVGIDGRSRIFGFTTLRMSNPDRQFRIITTFPTDSILAEAHRQLARDLAVVAATLIAFLASGWFVIDRFILRRLLEMSRGIDPENLEALASQAGVEAGVPNSAPRDELDLIHRSLGSLERRIHMIMDASSDGIVGLDATGLVTFVNGAALRMTGYEASELVGRSFHRLVHRPGVDPGPVSDFEICPLLQIAAKGEMFTTKEDTYHRKDGSTFPIEAHANAIRVGERFAGCGLFFRDITEKKLLEAQFRQSQKMEAVGQLASGVAHDFNNLLTVILGHTEIALLDAEGRPELEGHLHEIETAGERASGLTRQLLAFSRKQVVDARLIPVNDAVAGMEKMLRRLIGETIALVTDLDPNAGTVRADLGQVEQVLMNLVVNARDAMPNGGKLVIETRSAELEGPSLKGRIGAPAGDYVQIAVSDTGTGMDESTLARIFEPFFTTKDPGRGTGLGLATVFGIVRQFHGEIVVYSQVGFGTSFKIYLPRVRENGKAIHDAGKHAELFPRGTETILVVEDDAAIRALAAPLLERLGYRVHAFASPAEAQAFVATAATPVDLAVLDVVLPGMSGLDLARILREKRPALGVVYMSGYSDRVIEIEKLLAPGTAFLQKPFTAGALCRRVREVLDASTEH